MKKKIKPKKGLKVPFPMTRTFLPEKGEKVVWSSYWVRRLNEGAIELVEDSKIKKDFPIDKTEVES